MIVLTNIINANKTSSNQLLQKWYKSGGVMLWIYIFNNDNMYDDNT